MDPTILTGLISGGAAVLGAVAGATGTITSARMQHRLTTASERQKEGWQRMKAAAERCRTSVEELATLTSHNSEVYEEEEDVMARLSEKDRLRKEISVEVMYLSPEVRERVQFAVEVLGCAHNLVGYGVFYQGLGSIATGVVAENNSVLTAAVQDAPLPAPSGLARQLRVAVAKLTEEMSHELAEEIGEREERERRWLEANPEAQHDVVPQGRLARFRERLRPATRKQVHGTAM